jgi:hypothetical protein
VLSTPPHAVVPVVVAPVTDLTHVIEVLQEQLKSDMTLTPTTRKKLKSKLKKKRQIASQRARKNAQAAEDAVGSCGAPDVVGVGTKRARNGCLEGVVEVVAVVVMVVVVVVVVVDGRR